MKYSVRFYKPEDFESVIELLEELYKDTPVQYNPYTFGFKSLVLEKNGEIIGFCWVIAGDAKTVYINDFVVKKKYWYRKNNVGLFLAKAMVGLLHSQGYEDYLANIQPSNKKMYKMLVGKLKGIDCKEHNLIKGTIKELNESLLSF